MRNLPLQKACDADEKGLHVTLSFASGLAGMCAPASGGAGASSPPLSTAGVEQS